MDQDESDGKSPEEKFGSAENAPVVSTSGIRTPDRSYHSFRHSGHKVLPEIAIEARSIPKFPTIDCGS